MSENRFTYDKPLVAFSKGGINDNVTGETYEFTMDTVLDLLNEQQATIQSLQGDVNRLQYIIDELRKDNYKRFEKINELKAQLREKEEDEKLYANEILELRETNKEHIKFKSLGGNY